MEDEQEIRRRRLKYRSWTRGMRETDLLLGRFADSYINALTPEQLDGFELLLDQDDVHILDWFLGRRPNPPCEIGDDLTRMLKAFNYAAIQP